MKKTAAITLIIALMLTLTACEESFAMLHNTRIGGFTSEVKFAPAPDEDEGEDDGMININITVGDAVFSAKLYDNDATSVLLKQFPMTLNMSELNGNEKYFYLANNLPSESAERPATINAGELMCWSGNCLVLFYETFTNSFGGYVRLGYIEDVSGLADALGSGSVQIMFETSRG